MHDSSLKNMNKFILQYLDKNSDYKILDIGSQDVRNDESYTYKALLRNEGAQGKWTYIGCDVVSGNNVDVVLENVYHWSKFKTESVDCVISGQALEHIEYFWLTVLEIYRVLKQGGVCCIIVPSAGPEHKYPLDCYRYYPDGLKAMCKYSGLEVIETYTQWDKAVFPYMDEIWRDSVLVCRKPVMGWKTKILRGVRNKMIRRCSQML
jgi:SAM-dependent methyltransferase